MKRARLIVLTIAVVAAGGAAMLAKELVTSPEKIVIKHTQFETKQVLVAKRAISLGDFISAEDMRWQEWPAKAATNDYITKSQTPKALTLYAGSIVRSPFLTGEPIKKQKLIKAGDGGVLAVILEPGMRAFSTSIREETAVGGFILPNDHVDVIITRRFRSVNRNEEHISETVLRNIRVLAIGQNIETKDGKKIANGKTATLELSPQHAELLALAGSMGEVSLSLRSLADAGKKNSTSEGDNPLSNNRGSSVKLLKYGFSSRAFGVN